mmetsp:Transcript_3093/g.12741  ORF Transcript_3093/g.12741 Transcript_3093/m.12741 type:complete len:221 (-) Transcript_3093:372-1034(-)
MCTDHSGSCLPFAAEEDRDWCLWLPAADPADPVGDDAFTKAEVGTSKWLGTDTAVRLWWEDEDGTAVARRARLPETAALLVAEASASCEEGCAASKRETIAAPYMCMLSMVLVASISLASRFEARAAGTSAEATLTEPPASPCGEAEERSSVAKSACGGVTDESAGNGSPPRRAAMAASSDRAATVASSDFPDMSRSTKARSSELMIFEEPRAMAVSGRL